MNPDASSPMDRAADRDVPESWPSRLFVCLLVLLLAAIASSADAAGPAVTTRSYDTARTGWNQSEPALTPSTVTPSTFHRVGELRVDDKIEASPLYVPGVTTPSGLHDLL